MSRVTVLDLPPAVVEALEERARIHGRSMEAEIRAILEMTVMDRRLLMKAIEHDVARHARPTSADEVNGWLRASRGRPS